MNAVRFGSYSSRSTVAGDVPQATLEVDDAIALLVAAARCRARSTWPLLLRPPDLVLPSVSALTGLPL